MNIILIIIFVIIAISLLIFIIIYNKLINSKALVDEAWSGIDVQLKRRHDLIPNLVETVKGYGVHEKSIFEQIAKMRAASIGATEIGEKIKAEGELTNALKTLFAVAENYPNLKASENFLALQKDLSSIENELQLARRYYNGSARNYNIVVQSFPSNLVATLANFKKVPYFEVTTSEEKATPKVKF